MTDTKRKRGRPPRTPSPLDARIAELARLAIDWPRVSLEDISEGTGWSVPSLTSYRAGGRRVTPQASESLANWIRVHAKEGMRIADELDEIINSSL